MPVNLKYTRIEWERRFLLSRLPTDATVVCTRRIVDRYIVGTRLLAPDERRWRTGIQTNANNTVVLRRGAAGTHHENVSHTISQSEYAVLMELPANLLYKVRNTVLPFGIDVFEGDLQGLVLAEAEVDSESEAKALTLPSFIIKEVTHDHRFTGGGLAIATRTEPLLWSISSK